MKLRTAAAAMALMMSSTAMADEVNRKWDCWGTYTDIKVESDHTGWELSITPDRVTLVAAEGQIVGSVARNVRFNGNWMVFNAFEIDHGLTAICRKNDVGLVIQGQPYTLKRGSWTRRHDVRPLWVD